MYVNVVMYDNKQEFMDNSSTPQSPASYYKPPSMRSVTAFQILALYFYISYNQTL